MNAEQFVDWLSGYLDAINHPTVENIEQIKNKMLEIKEDVISPNFPIVPNPTWPAIPQLPFHDYVITCNMPAKDALTDYTALTRITC